jgi:hypothetical protein
MSERTINDVRCPRCKAVAGDGCVTPSGNPANEPHAARVARFWAEESKRAEDAR